MYSLFILLILLILVMILYFGHENSLNDLSTSAELLRPQNDQRSYKALILNNDLKVLLISDP